MDEKYVSAVVKGAVSEGLKQHMGDYCIKHSELLASAANQLKATAKAVSTMEGRINTRLDSVEREVRARNGNSGLPRWMEPKFLIPLVVVIAGMFAGLLKFMQTGDVKALTTNMEYIAESAAAKALESQGRGIEFVVPDGPTSGPLYRGDKE